MATTGFSTPKGNIQVTTGNVKADVLNRIESDQGSFSSNTFAGNNFVNKEAGFLFSIDHPLNWQIASSQGRRFGNAEIVNSFSSTDGSNMNVVIEELSTRMNFAEYVDLNVQGLFSQGLVTERPPVEMYPESNTAIFYHNNISTGGLTYQKLILSGNRSYVATANISPAISNPVILEDMLQMLSSFTVIVN